MSWDPKIFKLMKSIRPIDLYEILTRGICYKHTERLKKEVIDIEGEYYLNNWRDRVELDSLSFYISDSNFHMYLPKIPAMELRDEFKSWKIFDKVSCTWFNDYNYIVGFNYNHEAFSILYKEWIRDKKIDKILN